MGKKEKTLLYKEYFHQVEIYVTLKPPTAEK